MADEPLEVRLLGGPLLRHGGRPLRPASRKALAAAAFLATRPDGATRDELAELLWAPGKLASVRQALYELRKLPGAETWLVQADGRVRLRSRSDVAAFEAAVQAGDPRGALEAWGGRLLAGLDDPTPAYAEWRAVEQDRLEMMRLDAVHQRALELEREGALGDALAALETLMRDDPLNETAYRGAMRLHAQLGHPQEALATFERCRERLRQELDVAPLPATRALADAISRGGAAPEDGALADLPASLGRLLQAVAVARGDPGAEVLAHAVDRDPFDVAADLAELQRRGLVDERGALARHVRGDAATTTPAPLARLLHGRIAEAEEAAGGPPVRVARHWLGAHRPERAAPWLRAAARGAVEGGDLAAAERLAYGAAWAAGDDPEARLGALLLLETVAQRRQDVELRALALRSAEAAARALQSDEALFEVRLRASRQALDRGRPEEGSTLAHEALEAARRLGDAAREASARNAVGAAAFHAGRLDDAARAFEGNADAPQLEERVRARSNLGVLAGMRGEPDDAIGHFEAALALARRQGRRAAVSACLNNLAATAERWGRYARAARTLEEARLLASERGERAVEARLLANRAAVDAKRGAFAAAWDAAVEVERVARERGDARLRGQAIEIRGEIARHCAAHAEAEACYRAAADAAEEAGDARKRRQLEAQLAVLAVLDGGRPGRAPGASAAEAAAVGRAAGGGDRRGSAALARAEARLDEMEAAGDADLAAWLRCEVALRVSDPLRARRQAERALGVGDNRHRECLARAALAAARREHDGVVAAAEAAERLGVAEVPLLWRLAAELADGAERARADLRRARRAAEARARGLPDRFRRSLLAALTAA